MRNEKLKQLKEEADKYSALFFESTDKHERKKLMFKILDLMNKFNDYTEAKYGTFKDER